GFQRHRLRQMRDLLEAIEDQMPRVRVLSLLAIDEAPDSQIVGIAQLIGSDDPRTERRVRVERLAEHELRCAQLPIPHAEIVCGAITEYHLGRTFARNM